MFVSPDVFNMRLSVLVMLLSASSWAEKGLLVALNLSVGFILLAVKQLSKCLMFFFLLSFRQQTLWRFDRNDASTISLMCWRELD